MEEQKTIERPLMSEEEFKDYMEKNRVDIVRDFYGKGILHLRTYEAVSKFKSVRRAIRRGHVSLDGISSLRDLSITRLILVRERDITVGLLMKERR